MTIDAGNSSEIVNSTIRSKDEPLGSVFTNAGVKKCGYDKRLFFYRQNRPGASINEQDFVNSGYFSLCKSGSRNCLNGGKSVRIWSNYLAFPREIYYINALYNVVRTRSMQGVAGLRKVAEVVVMNFVYLTLFHIANSKGTFVAK